jgi:hypothetical protein
MRTLTLLALGVWLGLAALLYDMKYESLRLEARAAALGKALQEERELMAVARAEWSHVTRPENVEKLARAVLKFEPVKPEQTRDLQTAAKRPGVPAPKPASASDAIAALIGRTAIKSAAHDAASR